MLVREKAWLGLVFLKTGRIFIRKQRFIINPAVFHLVRTGSLLPAPGCRNAWIKSITVHICCLENKVVSLTVGGISAAAVLYPSSLCIPPTPHFPDTRHPLPSTSRHQMAPSLCLSPPDHWGPSLCLPLPGGASHPFTSQGSFLFIQAQLFFLLGICILLTLLPPFHPPFFSSL